MSAASSVDTQESGTARLSVRDEAKPFILIAAIAVGIVLNRIAGGTLSVLEPVVQVGLFLVIFSIMAFVAGLFLIALAIGRAFKLGYADTTAMVFEVTARNSESVVGVAAVAFTGRPLVILAIFIGPIIELPALLALTRVMLHLRHSIGWPDDPLGGTTGITPHAAS
jgi:ACR3 family arsenite efflux pump ArsB